MLESKDPVLRKTAIERIKTDEKTLKHLSITELTKLTQHPNPLVRETAENALGQTHAKQEKLSALMQLPQNPNPLVRREIGNALAQKGEKRLQALTQLTQHPDLDVCEIAVSALGHMGEKALPALTQLTQHPDPNVHEAIANALGQIGEKGLPALTQLRKNPHPDVRRAVANAQSRIKTRRAMLGTRRPFASTAHLPEILKRTKILNAVSRQLKHEFSTDFIGIVVFGSTAKGYARPQSDVDYAVIASNPAAAKRFHELSTGNKLPLCEKQDINYVNPREKNNATITPLFSGLFFGDRRALKKAQRAVFTRFANNPKGWDRVREEILENETRLGTAFGILGIEGKREQQRLNAAAALRVPPPYKEMKKMLGIK